jgi:hypothetical protein
MPENSEWVCTLTGETMDSFGNIIEEDYSREFGMACWCDEAEQCENEDHA